MEAVRWLRESGVTVTQHEPTSGGDVGADFVLDVRLGDQSARFAVEVKRRAPYPNELERLRQSQAVLSRWGTPLLIVPYVRQEMGNLLSQAGLSWADAQGDFDLRAPGLLLRQRRRDNSPRPTQARLPRGPGSYGVIRALIDFDEGGEEEPGATALASQARVSQPRASQVLAQLRDQDLVERRPNGRWRPRKEALLDRFLAEYPGPGGADQFLYTLDPPLEAAVTAARILGDQVSVSADVGPDLLEPWRRPSAVILYVRQLVDPESLGLVEAQGRHDANVIIRMPEDYSVFPFRQLVAEAHGIEVQLADPTQMIWDLLDLGGADRAEAAGRLREWLLASR
jgi:hypothetical protein